MKLSEIHLHYLKSEDPILQKNLEFYKSSGIKKTKIFMRAEGLSGDRYFLMDLEKSLKKNLSNKIVIEFPVFHVVLDHSAGDFQVVDEDELPLLPEFRDAIPHQSSNDKSVDLGNSAENPRKEPAEADEELKENSEDEIEPENFLFSKDEF
jgi:hypothetical protein